MKKVLLAAAIMMFGNLLIAQQAKPAAKALKKVMTLKMPKTEDDDMPGTRGASVTWHPLLKKYYAVFAGNQGYPLAVFDATGKRVSADDLTAFIDTRGLWYNPFKKQVMGNSYNDFGWFRYELDAKGLVKNHEVVLEGMNQPDAQSVGAYNSLGKQVLFLKSGKIFFYTETGNIKDSLVIHWGRTKADGAGSTDEYDLAAMDYNYTTVVYTGIKGSEIGLLNVDQSQIELYDIKTGFMTKKIPLPEDTKTELSFNFAYANGIYWLFSMENREWYGYK